jgi:hypothetical protein
MDVVLPSIVSVTLHKSVWDVLAGDARFPRRSKNRCLLRECCGLCSAPFPGRSLQVDHRIPYKVAGDDPSTPLAVRDYTLLCGSCNRAKSWSCEHCENWCRQKKPETCMACCWASPLSYQHVAMVELRRLDLTWVGAEIQDFEALRSKAARSGTALAVYVKALLRLRVQQPAGRSET